MVETLGETLSKIVRELENSGIPDVADNAFLQPASSAPTNTHYYARRNAVEHASNKPVCTYFHFVPSFLIRFQLQTDTKKPPLKYK